MHIVGGILLGMYLFLTWLAANTIGKRTNLFVGWREITVLAFFVFWIGIACIRA